MAQDPLQLHSPDEMSLLLGQRIRALRLRAGWKRETLAERAGVSVPTISRFERTGRTSLATLLRLCHALGRLDDFADLLQAPAATSLAELEARSEKPVRRRGTR